jgi:hypothetical protein
MKSTLSLDSPAFQAITELRRAVTLIRVEAMLFVKGIDPFGLRLKEPLAQAPCARFWASARRATRGLSQHRNAKDGERDKLRQCRNLMHRTFLRGAAGFFQVLVLLEQIGGIVAHLFYRAPGALRADCPYLRARCALLGSLTKVSKSIWSRVRWSALAG